MPHISLSRRRGHSWPTTSSEAGPSRLTNDNSIDVLIDSQVTLANLVDAVSNVALTVYLTQLEFQPHFVAVYDAAPTPVLETPKPKEVLTDVICRTAQKNAVRVFILLNQTWCCLTASTQYVMPSKAQACVRAGFPPQDPT